MKKLIKFLPVIAAVVLIAAGCNSGANSSDPKAVLKSFFEKMAKKDIDGAAKLATKDSKSTMDMMKKAIDMGEKMQKDMPKEEDPTEAFKDVEYGEAKIEGDVATVPITNKKENKTIEFPLKKEGGGWKVDFTMATLMKMGKDQMGGQGSLDGMDEKGNDVNVNADDLKKSLEAADSMMKNMDPEKLKEMQKAMEKLKEQ